MRVVKDFIKDFCVFCIHECKQNKEFIIGMIAGILIGKII